jgi:hypothetical protein
LLRTTQVTGSLCSRSLPYLMDLSLCWERRAKLSILLWDLSWKEALSKQRRKLCHFFSNYYLFPQAKYLLKLILKRTDRSSTACSFSVQMLFLEWKTEIESCLMGLTGNGDRWRQP